MTGTVTRYMYIHVHPSMGVCVLLTQELERAFLEAKSQVESGAVECGDSEDEEAHEVSGRSGVHVHMTHTTSCT